MAEKAPEKLEIPAAEPAPKPSGSGEESPTTGRDPDFDDDAPEAPVVAPERLPTPSKGPKRVSFQDAEEEPPAPPPKPPRPISPKAHAEATLIEAFPSIDAKVVKAVLVASGGKVEPAFNALLSKTFKPRRLFADMNRYVGSKLQSRHASTSSATQNNDSARVG
jgi:CUE domain